MEQINEKIIESNNNNINSNDNDSDNDSDNDNTKSIILNSFKDPYEMIIPAIGVSLQQNGKDDKKSKISFQEKIGKFDKSMFQSMLAKQYMKTKFFVPELNLDRSSGIKTEYKNEEINPEYNIYRSSSSINENTVKYSKRINITGDISQLWKETYTPSGIKMKNNIPTNPLSRFANKDIVKSQKQIKTTTDIFNMTLTNRFKDERQFVSSPKILPVIATKHAHKKGKVIYN